MTVSRRVRLLRAGWAALLLICLGTSWRVWERYQGRRLFLQAGDVKSLEQALRRDPEDPDILLALGLFYRDRPGEADHFRAAQLLEQALRHNPHDWRLWMELARTREILGEVGEAERCYREALRRNPRQGSYHFRMAHFFLRQGRLPDALPLFQQACLLDPQLTLASAELLRLQGLSLAQMENYLPLSSSLFLELLQNQLWQWKGKGTSPDPAFLEELWGRILSAEPPPATAAPDLYLEYLLSRGEGERARQARLQLASRHPKGLSAGEGENRVWNGGFEVPFQGAFDWQWVDSQAVRIRPREGAGPQGSRALEIQFIDLQEGLPWIVQQKVLLGRGRAGVWELSWWARWEELEGDQGPYWELLRWPDLSPLGQSPMMLGSQAWKSYRLRIAGLPPQQVLVLRLARRPSRRLDKSLRGKLWLDEVRLSPVASPPGLQLLPFSGQASSGGEAP